MLLIVAKDKIKLALNIIKTSKEIVARGNKVQLCALYKSAGDGRGKLFTLILGQEQTSLLNLSGKKVPNVICSGQPM